MKNIGTVFKTMLTSRGAAAARIILVTGVVGFGVMSGSTILADEAKLNQPKDLASQVIDNGANQDGAEAPKRETQGKDDEAKAIPHFAGHAFAE